MIYTSNIDIPASGNGDFFNANLISNYPSLPEVERGFIMPTGVYTRTKKEVGFIQRMDILV